MSFMLTPASPPTAPPPLMAGVVAGCLSPSSSPPPQPANARQPARASAARARVMPASLPHDDPAPHPGVDRAHVLDVAAPGDAVLVRLSLAEVGRAEPARALSHHVVLGVVLVGPADGLAHPGVQPRGGEGEVANAHRERSAGRGS